MNVSVSALQLQAGKAAQLSGSATPEQASGFGAIFSLNLKGKGGPLPAPDLKQGMTAELKKLLEPFNSSLSSGTVEEGGMTEELKILKEKVEAEGGMVTVADLSALLPMDSEKAAAKLNMLPGVQVSPEDSVETMVSQVLEAGEKLLKVAKKLAEGKGMEMDVPMQTAVKLLKTAQELLVKPVLSHAEEFKVREIQLQLKEIAAVTANAESAVRSRKELPVFRAAIPLQGDSKSQKGLEETVLHSSELKSQDSSKATPSAQRVLDGLKAISPNASQQPAQEGERDVRPAGKLSEEFLTSTAPADRLAQSGRTAEKTETPRQLPAQEFSKILNRAQFGQSNGTSRLLLRINPENIGTIRVQIIQREGVSTVQLLTSTSHGKELLDSSLSQLKQAFVQQNLTVDRVEIAQALQDASGKNRQQQSSGQEPQERQSNAEEQESEFKEFLLDLEV